MTLFCASDREADFPWRSRQLKKKPLKLSRWLKRRFLFMHPTSGLSSLILTRIKDPESKLRKRPKRELQCLTVSGRRRGPLKAAKMSQTSNSISISSGNSKLRTPMFAPLVRRNSARIANSLQNTDINWTGLRPKEPKRSSTSFLWTLLPGCTRSMRTTKESRA